MTRRSFSNTEAEEVAASIGLDLGRAAFSLEDFRRGMDVELEHGSADPRTDVTGDDPSLTGKIAWAHLNEFPDYYRRLDAALDRMESQAEEERADWVKS